MRTGTFLALCSMISAGFVLALEFLLNWLGIFIPYFDWIVFDLIKFAIIFPFIILLLNPLNNSFKLWRKMRGRDIEAEELYETESGFISISKKENNVSRLLEK